MEVENIKGSMQHLQLTNYKNFENEDNIANDEDDQNDEEDIINIFSETGNNSDYIFVYIVITFYISCD